MAYFNYHAKIKQKICNGELVSYHFEEHYKGIGFALVLCFEDRCFPIREYRFIEYFELIGDLYSTQHKNGVFITKYVK